MDPIALSVVVMAKLTDFASDSAGTALVMTGFSAGGMRAWATLMRYPAGRIERATAIGFVTGVACMILFVLVDTKFNGGWP